VPEAPDSAVWAPGEDNVIENLGTPGTFIYAGSYGLMTYSAGRTFVYDNAAKHVLMHNKYYLTFNGTAFAQSTDEADAAAILLFRRAASAEEEEPQPPTEYPEPETITRDAVANADGDIIVAFSSDIHYDGQNMNLQTWLEKAEEDVGYIDAMGFCGDMGSAYASNADDFWTWTGAVVDYVDTQIDAGKVGDAIYTQGNHEWFPSAGGDYANEYANYDAAGRMMQVGEGLVTDKYIIYCFGAGEIAKTFKYDYNEFDIAELKAYLETAPTDIPIFILTHFPIHYWYGRGEERYMKHANEVIDALNTRSNVVVLWGHNHSDFDDNYYAPKYPGDEIRINPEGDMRTLNFTYLAAGCTADTEYTGPSAGSAATLPKGLVATIAGDGSISYVYYTIDGEKMGVVSPWLVKFRTGVDQYPFIASQYVEDGSTVTEVAAPEIDGYNFIGWYCYDTGAEVEFDFATPITRNLLVTAKYEKIVLPTAEESELDPNYVYVTLQDKQETAVGTSGKPIALYPIPYTEGMTIGDAYVKLHELEFEGGTEGVTVADSGYGAWYLTKVWGYEPEHGSWIFDRASSVSYVDANSAAVPGTSYYALAYGESGEWKSTSFMTPAKTETEVGTTITMAAMTCGMDSSYNYAPEGVSGSVYVGTGLDDLADTGITTEDGYFDISFDEAGEYIVVVKSTKGEAFGYVTVKDYTWGEPEWIWADDYSSATALFTAVENEELTEEVEAEVTSRFVAATDEEDAKTVYTAAVEFNGESYTDEQEVPIPDDDDEEPDDEDEEPAEETPADEAPAEEAELPFSDVPETAWYYANVCAVYEAGLMKGMDDGTFSPLTEVTRAQFITILYRLAGEPDGASIKFDDVAANAWYAPAVAWAASNGIVLGVSEKEFAPNNDITREQFVTILYRYARYMGLTEGPTGTLTGFNDIGSVSSWAAEAMNWAVEVGLIQGDKTGALDPTGTATRAQAAAIFDRFMTWLG
jgi:uncharacterized repeat protein (TIGR02543 family)